MEVGVIADTHGVLEPEVEAAYRRRRLEKILHAGDIGGPEVLRRLGVIAEVLAVAGNSDPPPIARGLPDRASLLLEGCKISMIHDLGQDDRPSAEVLRWIEREKPRVVIFGHLHRPVRLERDGVLYFNPGSAGLGRGEVPRSFGFLRIVEGEPEVSVETLPE